MSLQKEIEKATMIPWTADNAKFVRLKGPSQATKDRKVNERNLTPPRNIQLVEGDDADTFDDLETDQCFNEHEIASCIKAVNGGISLANESVESYIRSKQKAGGRDDRDETLSSKDSNSSTICNDTTASSQSDEDLNVSKLSEEVKESVDDKKEVLRKCGLSRNAAIGGLFMLNKISMKDLLILAIDTISVSSKEETSTQNNTGTGDETNDGSDEINLVPLPEDPEVFVKPWQAYGKLDPNKCKGIDFTVDRLGTKETVTPRQFYITETDDSSFQFVKRAKK